MTELKTFSILPTDGSEFLSVVSKVPYVGLYHYFLGQPYMGIDKPSPATKLVSIQFGVEAINFKQLKPRFGQHLKTPTSFKPSPTEKDYERSNLVRYFVKALDTKIITEVTEASHKFYNKKNTALKDLYPVVKLVWKITGPMNDVMASDGTILKTGIIETNQRTMALHKALFPELPLVLPADDLAKITS
tara:strand:- start:21 stop:587 length:567 start_codon:yes stop_codon:yes gene_type:complete